MRLIHADLNKAKSNDFFKEITAVNGIHEGFGPRAF